MNDFKLKIVLASLTGIVFSFIFIILAFVLPNKKEVNINYNPKGKLEQVSHSLRK